MPWSNHLIFIMQTFPCTDSNYGTIVTFSNWFNQVVKKMGFVKLKAILLFKTRVLKEILLVDLTLHVSQKYKFALNQLTLKSSNFVFIRKKWSFNEIKCWTFSFAVILELLITQFSKGCACYIFDSLLCKFKGEHLW